MRVLFQLEHPAADVGADDNPVIHLLVDGEPINRYRIKPPRESCQSAEVGLDGASPEVLQQVVMDVHAIHGRIGGMDLIEEREVVVDEVAEWFRRVHACLKGDLAS